ncbi:hypothetical protein [Nocardioides pantholopis]|uniref:hypothetical protein n=1 Tax=Nocardioides pantholopis TaxID=2483798 RepID=UPI000FD9F7AC|nr:hypothetical protein [Nocardioides pantholopis]
MRDGTLFGEGPRLVRQDVRELARRCARSIEQRGRCLPDAMDDVATAFNRGALVMTLIGDAERAETMCRQLIGILDGHGGRRPRTPAYGYALQPRLNLGRLQLRRRALEDALETYETVYRMSLRALPEPASAIRRAYVVDTTRALVLAGDLGRLRDRVVGWRGDPAFAGMFQVVEAGVLAAAPMDQLRGPWGCGEPTFEHVVLRLHTARRLLELGECDAGLEAALATYFAAHTVIAGLDDGERGKLLAYLARLLELGGDPPTAATTWESVAGIAEHLGDEVLLAEALGGTTRTSPDCRRREAAARRLVELSAESLYVAVRGERGPVPAPEIPELARLEHAAVRLGRQCDVEEVAR